MKKILVWCVCMLAVVACKNGAKDANDLALNHTIDSLNRVNYQKDSEISDMLETLNVIQEGFKAINEAEGRVTVERTGEGANNETKIRENVQFIQSKLAENRELINKLRIRLREGSIASEQLKKTVESLSEQLQAKTAELEELRKELAEKDIHIAELDEKVSIRDGLTLYKGDEKMGGFKLTSVGKTASPFSLPDGTYEVYRTYDPRIDTIKNMIGEPPKFTGDTERVPAHVPIKVVERDAVPLPEMSFYISSIKNLEAVLPHADRVYFEMNDSLTEAQEICDNAGVEIVTHIPRLTPTQRIETGGRPIMINTPGQYIPKEGDRVYASQFMNMFNSYMRAPFYQTTLSPELSNEEIRNIAQHYPGRLEVMVFGRQELMCTRDPAMHNGILVDEKSFRFPVYKDVHGLSHILNSSDTILLPYLGELGRMGIDSVGIDLRRRPENIARRVAEAYANNDVKAKFDLQEMCGGLNYGAYLRGTE